MGMGKEILYLPEIDYLVSLQTYCIGKKDEDQAYDQVMEDGSLVWEKFLKGSDMYFISHDAQMIFKSRMFNALLIHHILKNSVDDLIALTGEELYNLILDYREIDQKKREYREIVYAEIERTINESYNKSEEDLIVMREFVFNTDSFKSRLDDILKSTYKIFTEEIYTETAQGLIEKVLERFQNKLDSDEVAFSDSITVFGGSEPQKLPEELTLCMLYFASQQYIVMLKDMLVLFGREIPKYVKHVSKDSRIALFLKALSEPVCYKMIKLLSKTPFYGAELSRELGIPGSELEKHISHIQRTRILTAMKGEKNRIYFEISKDEVEKLLENLKSDLLNS